MANQLPFEQLLLEGKVENHPNNPKYSAWL